MTDQPKNTRDYACPDCLAPKGSPCKRQVRGMRRMSSSATPCQGRARLYWEGLRARQPEKPKA